MSSYLATENRLDMGLDDIIDYGAGNTSSNGQYTDKNNASTSSVFVGNLSWTTAWQDLKDHMKQAGEVVHADVMAESNGRSKGWGLVEFSSPQEAMNAIQTLNNTELDGRSISVREDRESGTGNNNANRKQNRNQGNGQDCRVYIGNLSWDTQWQDLKDHMRQLGGDVTRADIMTGPDGRSKGCGIVEFASSFDAHAAISQLNNSELQGRQILVREDREENTMTGGNINNNNTNLGAGSTRVYVNNLAWDVKWQDLKDHMRQAGNVTYAEVFLSLDDRSKGCGIVEYDNTKAAAKAMRELNGSDLNGRQIYVREDREDKKVENKAGNNRNNNGGAGGRQLFVGNLTFDTTWQDLKDHFAQSGTVERSDIVSGNDGRSKGFGLIKFANRNEANRAINQLNGTELNGRQITVKLDEHL